MHYADQVRAFQFWLEDGCPNTVTVEVDDEPQQVAADDFLRNLLGSTDVMPGRYCEQLTEQVPYVGSPADLRGMSYGQAAEVLLAQRQHGDRAGTEALERMLAEAREDDGDR